MAKNIREETERMLKIQEKRLEKCKQSLSIIESLPLDIQNLCGNLDTDWANCDYHISFWKFDNTGIDLIRVLKMNGVQGLVLKMANSTSPEWWETKGEFMAGDKKIGVQVYGLPKPQTCRIEEYEETQVVKKYKAICNETGEQIGE